MEHKRHEGPEKDQPTVNMIFPQCRVEAPETARATLRGVIMAYGTTFVRCDFQPWEGSEFDVDCKFVDCTGQPK
ncbi:MAG: hypothetical protein GF355_07070 [Candidatus Eisenbacteria bacterium]|nr:hypothetical protein [Candidatus Eisenbacteria bacterium]